MVDDLEIPGQFPEVRAELEAEPDTAALHARLAELDPVAAGRMEPTNRRRVVRALEVTLGSGRPFSSFGPGLDAYPPTPFAPGRPRPVAPGPGGPDRGPRTPTSWRRGSWPRSRRCAPDPQGLSRTAAQALGYQELLEHLEGRASLDDAVDLAVRRTRRFARRQRAWFRRDPRIAWLDVDGDDRRREPPRGPTGRGS